MNVHNRKEEYFNNEFCKNIDPKWDTVQWATHSWSHAITCQYSVPQAATEHCDHKEKKEIQDPAYKLEKQT